jgi:glycosyltransferase involved in cell wall biosynthesis
VKSKSISVLLPVKDGALFIERSIKSIIAQSYPHFELIIIDDHSVDNTALICNKYVSLDKRVKLIKSNGKGLVDALNYGASVAEGEYLARMDADDLSLPNRFEKQINFLNSHKDVSILGTWMRIVGWSFHEGFGNESFSFQKFPCDHADIVNNLKHVGSFFVLAHPTVMMKRLDFMKIGGYRKFFNRTEDLDLWVRFAQKGFTFANLDEYLLDYSASNTSITAIDRVERYLNTAILINSARTQKESYITDDLFPVSLEKIHLYTDPKNFFDLISDFIILLRGINRVDRTKIYKRLNFLYRTEISTSYDTLLEKASDPKSWPFEVNLEVIEDIKCIFA